MPPADLSLVKLESDGVLRVKNPHGYVDLLFGHPGLIPPLSETYSLLDLFPCTPP